MRGVIGALRQVAALLVAVAVQLAFDGRGAAAQLDRDTTHRVAQPQQVGDLQPLAQRQVPPRRCGRTSRCGGLLTVAGADPPAGAPGHAQDRAGRGVRQPGAHQLPVPRVAYLHVRARRPATHQQLGMPGRLAYRPPFRGLALAADPLTRVMALGLPRPRPRQRHPQPPGSHPDRHTLLTQLEEPTLPPPVAARAAHPGDPARNVERLPGQEAPPERILNLLLDGQMMAPAARASDSAGVPLERQQREVAQLSLRVLDTQALIPQRKERLAQPPIPGRFANPSSPGGRFETASLLNRGQEPNAGSRISLQVHRRTAFEEGVASIDRTWGAPNGTARHELASPAARHYYQVTDRDGVHSDPRTCTLIRSPNAPYSADPKTSPWWRRENSSSALPSADFDPAARLGRQIGVRLAPTGETTSTSRPGWPTGEPGRYCRVVNSTRLFRAAVALPSRNSDPACWAPGWGDRLR